MCSPERFILQVVQWNFYGESVIEFEHLEINGWISIIFSKVKIKKETVFACLLTWNVSKWIIYQVLLFYRIIKKRFLKFVSYRLFHVFKMNKKVFLLRYNVSPRRTLFRTILCFIFIKALGNKFKKLSNMPFCFTKVKLCHTLWNASWNNLYIS